mmetsp:Transcript_58804/g.144129  ORF Transcript_58804/g.144129 Transcript_58804/m.144129 type:complete len:306 (+) Transcript_58804:3173-4090(+)
MLIIGFQDGQIQYLNLDKYFSENKLEFVAETNNSQDEIKKIINYKKKEVMIASKKKGIKIWNLFDNKKNILLKNPYPNLRDFDIYQKTHIFVVFDKIILTWKKFSPFKWKEFARINLNDSIDRFLVTQNSNLMISTSLYQNKLNLWSFSNGKISFCGKFFLKEKIGSICNSPKNNYFVIGSVKGKLYLYNNFGILAGIISKKNIFKNDFFSVNQFPLNFFDQNTLFSGGKDKKICGWDIRISKVISHWKGHVGNIKHIDCSNYFQVKNSFLIASSDDLGVVKIWDIRKDKEFSSIKVFPKKKLLL